jgi:hypothetical protein
VSVALGLALGWAATWRRRTALLVLPGALMALWAFLLSRVALRGALAAADRSSLASVARREVTKALQSLLATLSVSYLIASALLLAGAAASVGAVGDGRPLARAASPKAWMAAACGGAVAAALVLGGCRPGAITWILAVVGIVLLCAGSSDDAVAPARDGRAGVGIAFVAVVAAAIAAAQAVGTIELHNTVDAVAQLPGPVDRLQRSGDGWIHAESRQRAVFVAWLPMAGAALAAALTRLRHLRRGHPRPPARPWLPAMLATALATAMMMPVAAAFTIAPSHLLAAWKRILASPAPPQLRLAQVDRPPWWDVDCLVTEPMVGVGIDTVTLDGRALAATASMDSPMACQEVAEKIAKEIDSGPPTRLCHRSARWLRRRPHCMGPRPIPRARCCPILRTTQQRRLDAPPAPNRSHKRWGRPIHTPCRSRTCHSGCETGGGVAGFAK